MGLGPDLSQLLPITSPPPPDPVYDSGAVFTATGTASQGGGFPWWLLWAALGLFGVFKLSEADDRYTASQARRKR